MKIYFVCGIRHSCYVRAERPLDALRKSLNNKEIQLWECPSVTLAEWDEDILKPKGKVLYELFEDDDINELQE